MPAQSANQQCTYPDIHSVLVCHVQYTRKLTPTLSLGTLFPTLGQCPQHIMLTRNPVDSCLSFLTTMIKRDFHPLLNPIFIPGRFMRKEGKRESS